MKTQEIFRLTGVLDRPVDAIEQALASANADLLIDFSAVTFASVEGLEWLEELLLRSQSYEVKVGFVSVPPAIYKVFKVAHIDSLLEACGALGRSGPAC